MAGAQWVDQTALWGCFSLTGLTETGVPQDLDLFVNQCVYTGFLVDRAKELARFERRQ